MQHNAMQYNIYLADTCTPLNPGTAGLRQKSVPTRYTITPVLVQGAAGPIQMWLSC